MNREREHPIDRIENIMLKTKLGTKIRDKIASVLVGLIIKKYTKKGKR